MIVDPCPAYVPPWWQWYPPVGTFIGILGCLGVIVPWLFRPLERMGRPEKALWTFIMFALALLEIRTLYLDRDQHDQEQAHANCEQIERFGSIADGIKKSVNQSKRQYQDTIDHVDGVLTTTQGVAKLAQENLENVTGGNSYAYVVPTLWMRPTIPLLITNHGGQILNGVQVIIHEIRRPSYSQTEIDPPIPIGALSAYGSLSVPTTLKPDLNHTTGIAEYLISISAQNGTVTEMLQFKESKQDFREFAYRLSVRRDSYFDKSGKRLIKDRHETLVDLGWSDGSAAEPPPK